MWTSEPFSTMCPDSRGTMEMYSTFQIRTQTPPGSALVLFVRVTWLITDTPFYALCAIIGFTFSVSPKKRMRILVMPTMSAENVKNTLHKIGIIFWLNIVLVRYFALKKVSRLCYSTAQKRCAHLNYSELYSSIENWSTWHVFLFRERLKILHTPVQSFDAKSATLLILFLTWGLQRFDTFDAASISIEARRRCDRLVGWKTLILRCFCGLKSGQELNVFGLYGLQSLQINIGRVLRECEPNHRHNNLQLKCAC